MKTQKANVINAIRNMVTPVALALTLLVSTAAKTEAQDTTAPIEIKYLGSINSQPVFQIEFENRKGEDVYLTLKDEEGFVVYAERFKNKKFSRKFQFSEPDLNRITVMVTSKKERQAQVFQVNKSSRVVEDVVVTKVH